MNSAVSTGGDRRRLRLSLRQCRRGLSCEQRARAESSVHRRIANSHFFAASDTVAIYDAFDGELDVWPLAGLALSAGKTVCLPVLDTGRRLAFGRLDADAPLVPNRMGIREPDLGGGRRIDRARIDLVITPLVGFDPHCNRLGMGAGYYDVTFGFLNRRSFWQHPKLVGVAFDQQALPRLAAQPWDVPLWRVVTPTTIYGPIGPLTGDTPG